MGIHRLAVSLTLEQARRIVDAALEHGRSAGYNPLTVQVLDAGGQPVAMAREDGSGNLRAQVALGKAYGALGIGLSSGAIGEANKDRPAFLAAVAAASQGRMVPVAGGVLALNDADEVVGAVGISGDTSDADEACCIAGIRAAGLKPDPDRGA